MAKNVTLNATVTVKVPKGIAVPETDWAARYLGEALKSKNRVVTFAVTTYDVLETDAQEINADGSISNTAPSQQDNA